MMIKISVNAVTFACIVFFSTLSHSLVLDADSDVQRLPDITAYGFPNLSKSITIENDGSYTISSRVPASRVAVLLQEETDIEVNIDLHYARYSTNLTAEGKQMMSTLYDIFRLLRKDSSLEVIPTLPNTSNEKGVKEILERRMNALKSRLNSHNPRKLNLIFSNFTSVQQAGISVKENFNDVWRIKLKRAISN